jgi:hypothetical protein
LVPKQAPAFEIIPPVSVKACGVAAVSNAAVAFSSPFYGMPWISTDLVLSFVNDAKVAATHVEFVISYDGDIDRVESSGTFAPGAQMRRTTALPPFVDPKHVSCRIARVDFSDGTSWRSGPSGKKPASSPSPSPPPSPSSVDP